MEDDPKLVARVLGAIRDHPDWDDVRLGAFLGIPWREIGRIRREGQGTAPEAAGDDLGPAEGPPGTDRTARATHAALGLFRALLVALHRAMDDEPVTEEELEAASRGGGDPWATLDEIDAVLMMCADHLDAMGIPRPEGAPTWATADADPDGMVFFVAAADEADDDNGHGP